MPTRRQFLAATAALPLSRFAQAAEPRPAGGGATTFACDLYARLAEKPGNVFCSPFSVRTVLALTGAGAAGPTRTEIQTVLRLDANGEDRVGETLAALKPAAGKKPGYELSTANALWVQAGYPLQPEFATRVEKIYQARAADCDFRRAPEPSRQLINEWVEQQTQSKIRDLLPAGSIDMDTRLVLTNAVYFKGTWASPFEKELTQDAPFHLADGSKKPVPLMHRHGGFRASDNPAEPFQVAELSYRGYEVTMLVVVPRQPDGLPAVEKTLTRDWLNTVRSSMQDVYFGELFLPRFTIETPSLSLKEPLQSMGLKTAFTAQADFSGITSPERLLVSDVFHKAFVGVDEAGTEAAAATGVVMAPTSTALPKNRITVRADRPFLFLLRHQPTDTVLFVGRYTMPGE